LDGSSRYIDVPDPLGRLNPATSITVEAWVNPSASQDTPWSPIVKKAGNNGGTDYGYSLEMAWGGVQFWVYLNGYGWYPSPVGSLPANTWTHIAGVYDGAGISLYVNGALVGTTGAYGTIVASANNLQIGHDPSSSGRYFNGLIDEASIYSRALAAAEVISIYNAGSAGKCVQAFSGTVAIQPASQSVCQNNAAAFTASVSGMTPAGYQWSFNGMNISGATISTYTRSTAQPGDAGTYSVTVTDSGGNTASNSASLTVNAQPSIVSQPNNSAVCLGGSATFAVSANGTAPLSYQWKLNEANIPGATASAFTTNNVQGGGIYSVGVSNACGGLSSANATLTINTPPSITSQPTSLAVCPGSNVTFSVSANGTTPLSYQWKFNDVNIPGATGNVFTTNNVQIGGTFTVGVTNTCGGISSSGANLTINTCPSITSQPTNLIVCQGSSAMLTVSATGTSPLTYQWIFNGTNIPGATASALSKLNAQNTDVGNYCVQVTNGCGTIMSSNAYLMVNVPPSITSQPWNQTAGYGSAVTFNVVADSVAALTYRWFKDGTALNNGGNISGADTDSLNLNVTSLEDQGGYTVTISDNVCAPIVSSAATLELVDPITTQPTSQSAHVGETVQFKVAAVPSPTAYRWQRNNVDLSDTSDILGSSSATLTLKNVQVAQAGTYTVRITSVLGVESSWPAALTICGAPQPLSQISIQNWVNTAVKCDGTVWQWAGASTPVQVQGLSDIIAASGGSDHSLALKCDGTVWAWGGNGDGQLGIGTTEPQADPVQVVGLSGAIAVAAGAFHSVALKADGTVWTWGDNTYGYLGDGTTVAKTTPVQITGLTGVKAIANGGTHSLALTGNGAVFAWGYGFEGQLGNGSGQCSSAPVPVSLSGQVTAIACGATASLFRKNDGHIWACGYNYYGEVGDGSTTQRNSPVPITNPSGVVSITGGGCHFFAVDSNGRVWAWGLNQDGQLGDGSQVNRSAPVQLSSTFVPTTLGAGSCCSLALMADFSLKAWGCSAGLQPTTVAGPPLCGSLQITGQPQSVSICSGATVNLRVTVTADNGPLSYQWQKNGADLQNGGKVVGANTANLTLSGVSSADTASYRVVVKNGGQTTTSQAATLTVSDQIVFTTQPFSRNYSGPNGAA
jgi:alpha-tubulin suppressor-like RCC1 family protein